jgi:hypothetical protein
MPKRLVLGRPLVAIAVQPSARAGSLSSIAALVMIMVNVSNKERSDLFFIVVVQV